MHDLRGSITLEWFENQDNWINKFFHQKRITEFCQKRNGTVLVPEIIVNPVTNKRIKVINVNQLNMANIVVPKKETITRNFLQGSKEYVKLSFLKKNGLV